MSSGTRSLKLFAVGGRRVGKSSLLYTRAQKVFPPQDWTPNVFDNFNTEVALEAGSPCQLQVYDAVGTDDYERLILPRCWADTDVFLLCIAIDQPTSMKTAREKWLPQMAQNCPDVPILLVGTKGDLRGDESRALVTREEVELFAREIDAVAYMECSALNQTGVDAIFECAAREAWLRQKQQRKRCVLM